MLPRLLAVAMVLLALYGIVVGSFAGGIQWWAAPVKVVVGGMLAGFICLPSLYVFACLSGASARIDEIATVLAGALAIMALLLVGFAPVAWLFSQSSESVGLIGSLHVLFWIVAVRLGGKFLLLGFELFGLRARSGLKAWLLIFLLVSLQMMTAVRPLLGVEESFLPKEKKWFVMHWADHLKAKR